MQLKMDGETEVMDQCPRSCDSQSGLVRNQGRVRTQPLADADLDRQTKITRDSPFKLECASADAQGGQPCSACHHREIYLELARFRAIEVGDAFADQRLRHRRLTRLTLRRTRREAELGHGE